MFNIEVNITEIKKEIKLENETILLDEFLNKIRVN